MVLKRQLREGGEEGCHLPKKAKNFVSTLHKGPNYARSVQEFVPTLEPIIRKWVQEAVNSAITPYMRSPPNQIESSGTRNIQLQFHNNLPRTLFTGSKITSDDGNPIKITLYDSVLHNVITSGPLSSSKVRIVPLDGDFGHDDHEDWSKKDFDRKTVRSREGRRPLLTGELTVHLQGGVGYIDEISFTDNSSWIRSGKFRLGAKIHVNSDELMVREGMSNAFKVKDHRGEPYQKHYPPHLNDEVWRLEKIGKEGSSHKILSQKGVNSVGDFLRALELNPSNLRRVINVSNKQWETIVSHATSCTLDDKKYMYMTSEGTALLFNSVYKVIEVSFDGHNFHPVDSLNEYQMKMVENLKPDAYGNRNNWVLIEPAPIVRHQMLLPSPVAIESYNNPNLAYQNTNFHIENDQSKVEVSFQPQGFNGTNFRNSFAFANDNPSDGLFTFGNNNYMGLGSQLPANNLLIEDNFQVNNTSAPRENGLFLGCSSNDMFGIGCSSNTGMLYPRILKAKTRWCKVLSLVKWRILVKRNVAARRWQAALYLNV